MIIRALAVISLALGMSSSSSAPLVLIDTFQLPSAVAGHFDHLAIDVKGRRLFVTPEEYKSVIVFDLSTGKVIHTIPGIGVPHAVLFRPDRNRIYVTDGEPGELKIFDATNYSLLKSIKLLPHSDSVGYDSVNHFLYVVTGGKDAGQKYSIISFVDTTAEKTVGAIKIDGDALEAMALEKNGPLLYINNKSKNQIDVIDRQQKKLIASWPITKGQNNTSIALDEKNHRLFVGCRSGKMVVLDTTSGKELLAVPMSKGVDDMMFDPARRRIYASCGDGQGSVDVFEQVDENQYKLLASVTSRPLGKTSLLSPELNRYFVSVPKSSGKSAAVLVYEVH